MTTPKNNKNKDWFSVKAIKPQLDAKIYQYRGLTRKAYIQHCKKLWDSTEVKKGQTKIIIDEMMLSGENEFMPGIELDHFSEYAKDLSGGIEIDPKLEETVKSIEKHFERVWNQKSIRKADLEAAMDKLKEIGTLGIHCFLATGGVFKRNKIIQTSLKDSLEKLQEKTFKSTQRESSYFIALFDILGFSKLVETIGIKGVKKKYDRLMKIVTASAGQKSTVKVKLKKNLYFPAFSFVPIKHAYFSDTIILWAPTNPEHFSAFLSRCTDLMCESIKIGLPLRGAVSCGQAIMYPESNKFIGNAIIEAARMESRQAWIGVTLCSSIFLNNLFPEIDEELIVPLYVNHLKLIPLKDHFKQRHEVLPMHETPYLTLDWIGRWCQKNDINDLDNKLLELKKAAPSENSIYYENTFDYYFYSSLWTREERGMYLRSTFLSIIFDTQKKFIGFNDILPEKIEPVVLVFNTGLYRFGYLLPIHKNLHVKDKNIAEFYKIGFYFIDYFYGGFCELFYEELTGKMLTEFQTSLFIEHILYTDLRSVDAYSFNISQFDSWNDVSEKRTELDKLFKEQRK